MKSKEWAVIALLYVAFLGGGAGLSALWPNVFHPAAWFVADCLGIVGIVISDRGKRTILAIFYVLAIITLLNLWAFTRASFWHWHSISHPSTALLVFWGAFLILGLVFGRITRTRLVGGHGQDAGPTHV